MWVEGGWGLGFMVLCDPIWGCAPILWGLKIIQLKVGF
jgi:hypothetical protein